MFQPPGRNPIIPGSKSDRTGSLQILRRARSDIGRRFDGLESDVLSTFERIPVYHHNDATMAAVSYGLTPEQLASVTEELQEALNRWLLQGRETDQVFWWDAYVDESSHLGTAQASVNMAGLSTTYASARSLTKVVYSDAYRTRVATAKFKSYEHWTGLAAQARADLAQVIGQAVADGRSPVAVKTLIADRLGVSRSRALGYAQTDITDTLRQARLAEAEDASASLGLRIGQLWTSALLPTTRPTHAARNGKVYTAQEVRDFYGKNGNRYRCHCSIVETLLDEDGKPILTGKLKAKMKAEREDWERENSQALA
jgi:hypothetical protein